MRRGWLLLVALTACGGASTAGDAGASFPPEPLAAQQSDGGTYQLELRSIPASPSRGENTLQLTVRDAHGQPVDGLGVALQPWMPAMGHGSSVTPTVVPQGHGLYTLQHVELAMPGSWQLRFTFTGAVQDHATFVVQIA